MAQDCTVQEHVAEVVAAARSAYRDGHRAGVLVGHRRGFDEGHLTGFDEGARSTTAYQIAARNEWISGYLARISDERAGGQHDKAE